MSRKRVIYQSEALFAGPTGYNFKYVTGIWDSGDYDVGSATAANRHNQALNISDLTKISTTGNNNINVTDGFYNAFFTGTLPALNFSSGLRTILNQMDRVQTANYSFEVTRQDINQFGQLAAIDRVILEQPTVNLDFSYYLNTGANEVNIGFTVNDGVGSANPQAGDKSAIADILSGTANEKNYYILTVPEGKDANIDGKAGGHVIGIGNGFLSSFSLEAAVGDIPTVTVNAEGLNMRFYTGTDSLGLPTVNPQDGSSVAGTFTIPVPVSGAGYTALRPGDVELTINGANGISVSDLKIQNATLSFDLTRESIEKLGSRFAFTKEITFPVTINLSVDAILGDLTSGNLSDVLNNDSAKYNLGLKVKQPNSSTEARFFALRGAKLDSQEFSSSIGDNKSVTLNWSAQIGGPTDSGNGIFMYSNG